MSTLMVTPSELHRMLENAQGAGAEERRDTLALVLESNNLAVIRRIPQLLTPLEDGERDAVYSWAVEMTGKKDVDVSDKDFAFHIMVNCGVSAELILKLLERNGTHSRGALEHIEQVLTGDRAKFDQYLQQVADELVKDERIPSRDRGRHILMTLAKTQDDWRTLAKQFTENFSDLRQRVIERFLRDCSDELAAETFCYAVIDECLGLIDEAMSGHDVARQMHWVISCAERIGWEKRNLRRIVTDTFSSFGRSLPLSVRTRLADIPRSMTTLRAAYRL